MNAIALFTLEAPAHTPAEPTDADLDAMARGYVARPWVATPDDARALAEAVRDGAVKDLADHRARKRAHRTSALEWLRGGVCEACDLGWCAAALGLSTSAVVADVWARVELREAEKAAHAEDLRRRRAGAVRLVVDRSSWAGHVMLAALVTRVTGGEWEVGHG